MDLQLGERWKAIEEPPYWMLLLLIIPVAIAACSLFALLWWAMTPFRDTGIYTFQSPLDLYTFFLWLLPIFLVRELMRLVVHPTIGYLSRPLLGQRSAQGAFYAHYDRELTRNCWLAILLMPLIVLSICPLLFASVARVSPELLVRVSIYNALLSGSDLISAGIVCVQIPAVAMVRIRDQKAYWRKHNAESSV